MWLLILILVIASIAGGLLILLRTARKPEIPKNFKPRRYKDDEDSGW